MDRCGPEPFRPRARAERGLMAARRQGIASRLFRVESKALTQNSTVDKVKDVETQLEQRIGVTEKEINVSTVGSTWGTQITKKAIYGLIIFLIAVSIYLSIRFEWRMALAAIIAL